MPRYAFVARLAGFDIAQGCNFHLGWLIICLPNDKDWVAFAGRKEGILSKSRRRRYSAERLRPRTGIIRLGFREQGLSQSDMMALTAAQLSTIW